MRRLAATLPATLVWLALLAPVALAGDNPTGGQGLYGRADDKVITFTSFILIAAFPLLIGTLSFLQWRLDRRKQARKAAEKARRTRAEWSGGW